MRGPTTSWRPASECGVLSFPNRGAENTVDSRIEQRHAQPAGPARDRSPSRTSHGGPRHLVFSRGYCPAMRSQFCPPPNHSRGPFQAGASRPASLLASARDGNRPTTATLHASRKALPAAEPLHRVGHLRRTSSKRTRYPCSTEDPRCKLEILLRGPSVLPLASICR